jgi:hypothetical protein
MSVRDQGRRTLLCGLMLFTLTASFALVRTGRDALYLVGDGLLGVPRAYVAIAVLSVPQATAMLWLLGRVGPRAARLFVLGSTLVVLAAYWALAEPGASTTMTVCFFVVPLVFSVAFSMAWLLGAELLDELEPVAAATAFGRLGAASIVGGLVGGALARTAGPSLGPRALVLLGGVFVTMTLALVIAIHRRFPAAKPGKPERARAGMLRVLGRRGALLLVGIAMAAAVTGIFVDFQFYLGAAGQGAASNTVYFANAYLFMSASSLVLQLLVAPRVVKWLGGPRTLLVLPTALLGGGSFVMAVGTVLARGGLRVLEGGLKNGVHRTGWEQSFLLFPPGERAAAKVVIDGLAARIGEGIAGVGLHYWLAFLAQGSGMAALDASWVAYVGAVWITVGLLITGLVWAGMTWLLGRRLRALPVDPDAAVNATRAPLPDS